jgi:alginate O-acetyltransferase complex protein AlgI
MLGLAGTTSASDSVAGAMYTPYYGVMFVLAAAVVWGLPNTWAFTNKVSVGKAVGAMALLGLAILMMWTQTTNPFLYFQF